MKTFAKAFLLAIILLLIAPLILAAQLPERAQQYLPVLSSEIESTWPAMKQRDVFGAQVEQETCASLRSSQCWSPHAEIKTKQEYGFGLGQLTVTKRFNTFNEVKALDRQLKDWAWEDRYDARLQLRAMLLKDRYNYDRFKTVYPDDRILFALAAYNGGLGGTMLDAKMCAATPNCDETRWFDNVERTSYKAKVKVKGYGKSFYEINREYVRNIWYVRRSRYAGLNV